MKLKKGNKTGLYYFGMKELRSWGPCYDPNRYLSEDFRGTALTILKDKRIPFQDRLWVVLHTDICSEKLMRLFAVWCTRQVQHLLTDPRSLNALDVSERFANGQATEQELSAARETAENAARATAGNVAWAAAWAAARVAARVAARETAVNAAVNAAGTTAGDAQIDKLIEMLKIEAKERVK